jgi:hypothetical protein
VAPSLAGEAKCSEGREVSVTVSLSARFSVVTVAMVIACISCVLRVWSYTTWFRTPCCLEFRQDA